MSIAKPLVVQIESITTIRQVLRKLKILNVELEKAGLSQFITFNQAYVIITEDIQHSLDRKHFYNPVFVEQFTVCFSHYYFTVINDSVRGVRLPPVWANLKNSTDLANFIYLLMGANAHINHDLTLAMVKKIDKDNTDELYKDVLKVDKILAESINPILDSFSEKTAIAEFIKKRFKFLYCRPIRYVILYWRVRAWREYVRISKDGIDMARLEARGKKISLMLYRLGLLLRYFA